MNGTLLDHLIELRKRLMRAVLSIAIMTVALLPFANELYLWLADPLMRALGEGGDGRMIATQVASPFLTPFKLSVIAAIFLAMPLVLYQIWAFIAPGLYQSERRTVLPLMTASTLLFYAGIAFAYYAVFPLIFMFLTKSAPDSVQVATDIALYLDFAIKLFFAFGLAFQIPVATALILKFRLIEASALSKKRPYVIVFAFILGMLLTPPDVISQVLLAIPVWLLFEAGLLVGALWVKTGVKAVTNAATTTGTKTDAETNTAPTE